MKYFLISLFFLIANFCISQNEIAESDFQKNSLYLELYGNSGLVVSVNYERLNISKSKFSYRIGLGVLPSSFITDNSFTNQSSNNFTFGSLPVEFDYLIGKRNHFLELGLGISYLFAIGPKPLFEYENRLYSDSFAIFSRIGYRYLNSSGYLIRVGFTPVIDFNDNFFNFDFPPMPYGGISFGYTF